MALLTKACDNNPWHHDAATSNTLYSAASESSPRHLDPTASYWSNDTPFTYQVYEPPYGYHYRMWHRGDYLPRSYYGSSYIVYDWRPYRLYAPPYGYHWVRVGNDVILTAIATGVVLDVIYDIWY